MSTAKSTTPGLPTDMTVDDFLIWAEGRPGRHELHDGAVIAIAPERVGHADAKGKVYRALADAIDRAKIPCRALPDGATVRIDSKVSFEPDALVYCGDRLANDVVEVPNPVIVVEVLSPSTQHVDVGPKLSGYFSKPSIAHCLIIAPGKRPLVHHQRQADGTILTRLVNGGEVFLDPPGLSLDVAALFG